MMKDLGDACISGINNPWVTEHTA